MAMILRGVIRGRTIELSDDPGLADGERVLVEVRSEPMSRGPTNGIHRTAGVLAEDPYWDGIMEEIEKGRRMTDARR